MYKTGRNVLRNVVICAFVIGLCIGMIFQTNDAYARVSLSKLQAQINKLTDRIEFLESCVPRFTDMGNGTIRDNATKTRGEQWIKKNRCR